MIKSVETHFIKKQPGNSIKNKCRSEYFVEVTLYLVEHFTPYIPSK